MKTKKTKKTKFDITTSSSKVSNFKSKENPCWNSYLKKQTSCHWGNIQGVTEKSAFILTGNRRFLSIRTMFLNKVSWNLQN
jgi:hypothetical protein